MKSISGIHNLTRYRLFCGGAFCFDYRCDGYEAMAAKDYRALLLGSVESLLNPKGDDGVMIGESITYVGPFYFETEDMIADDIIKSERGMIERCTDAVFILDNAACPGTIAELMYANSLQKRLHIFYVHYANNDETESDLHTPCGIRYFFAR